MILLNFGSKKLFSRALAGLSIAITFTAFSICSGFAQGTIETGSLYGAGAGLGGGLGAALTGAYGGKGKNGVVQNHAALKFTKEQLQQAQAVVAKLIQDAQSKEKAGNFKQAAKVYQDAASYREKVFGKGDPKVEDAYKKAGMMMLKSGQYAQAESALRGALSSCNHRNGPGSPQTMPILNDLAKACLEQKNYKDASSYYKQSLALDERAHGAGSQSAMDTRLNLAKVLSGSGQSEAAEPVLKQYIELAQKNGQQESAKYQESMALYADIQKKNNKAEQANNENGQVGASDSK